MAARSAPAALALALVLVILAGPSAAEPRGCFTAAEMAAEREVRHGIRLRETAMRCQQEGFSAATADSWKAIDQRFAGRFAAQAGRRRQAFQREFEGAAAAILAAWDGRLVNHFRHRPLTPALCRDVEAMLADIDRRGWRAFQRQAERAASEVKSDYKACP